MRRWLGVVLAGVLGCGGGGDSDDSTDALDDGPGDAIDAPPGDGGTDGTPMLDAFVPLGLHSVAAGGLLSCDLGPDGAATCWGQLGNEVTSTTYTTPHAYGGAMRFNQLSAFGRGVCGSATDGMAYCWGPNGDAQLGTGAVTDGTLTPTLVGTGRLFAKLFAGDQTACGITPDNNGLCWGKTNFGQVGADITSPNGVHSPLAIFGNYKWLTLSVSHDFTCGVTIDHVAYCWGSDKFGELGNGGAIAGTHADDKNVPEPVASTSQWASITTGGTFACGLDTAGAAYCWGSGLGTGSAANSSTPVALPGGHVFTGLDAGLDFACGVTTAGEAYCWGQNTVGQLGTGAGSATTPVIAPVHVAAGLTFSEISAGDVGHTCGATLDHAKVYCWGRNDQGQLGNGVQSAAATDPNPTPVQVMH